MIQVTESVSHEYLNKHSWLQTNEKLEKLRVQRLNVLHHHWHPVLGEYLGNTREAPCHICEWESRRDMVRVLVTTLERVVNG